ncbi:MAG TPA: ribosome small subunit-dependent GTPase A [Gammaproteobacteria bacterium]|nr:ribosome small subunit-dependent GTPase A [Gammaproteobacteria bacterium]
MAKRKINQQQQRRIANKHAQLLDSEELSGLVIAHHGQSLEITDDAGNVIICKKRQNLGPIVPGDRVKWQLDSVSNTGVVTAIEPRTSLLSRPDARDNMHAVAANVDQIFIVIAPRPAPNQTTIDRYLLAADAQNVTPILVLNKEDLLPIDPKQTELLELIQVYAQIGISTIIVSAKKLLNLAQLHAHMAKKTNVFVGQSGVGKSSLIATFMPEANIKIGDLSLADTHGRHTTTTARLYHLAELDCNLIDSPGMREFPLWKLDPATLASGFIEFRPFLHDCKFRNCLHNNEPGCALLTAVEAGKISHTRLLSYQKILTEMKPTRNNKA